MDQMKAYFNFIGKIENMLLLPACKLAFMESMGTRIRGAREAKALSRERLGQKIGVTVQAIGQWERDIIKGIRPDNMLRLLETLDTSLEYLVRGRTRKCEANSNEFVPTQHEQDLVEAYRTMPTDVQTSIWDLIDGHIRRTHPNVDVALGKRDIPHSLSAEPRIVTKQIVAQSKMPTKPAATPKPKKKKPDGEPAEQR